MNFLNYKFVSDDDAKTIMESYGYVVPSPEKQEEDVISEDTVVELPDYVCVVNESTYALCEGVEEIEGNLYIAVEKIEEELHEALTENETTILESVEMDDAVFEFGDIFEDKETGDLYVQINESNQDDEDEEE
jgi:actin-like ATPase involved in cell morphogenesis